MEMSRGRQQEIVGSHHLFDLLVMIIDDHDEGFIQQLIKYDDRYVRVDGEWRFTRRRHFLWLGWRHGEDAPLAQPPANWPERQVGLGSIPYDDPAWQEFWSTRE